MLSFSHQQQKKSCNTKLSLSEEAEGIVVQLVKQLSADMGIIGDLHAFKSAIEKEIFSVCQAELKEKDLDQIEREINEGKMDQLIFSDDPQLTQELKFFIENRSRSFCQTLLMKATSLNTLQYWFDQGGVKIPKDALALAIHLKCSKVVFEYIKDNSELLLNISQQDQKNLLRLATIKLKENQKESYELLLDCMAKSVYKLTPSLT